MDNTNNTVILHNIGGIYSGDGKLNDGNIIVIKGDIIEKIAPEGHFYDFMKEPGSASVNMKGEYLLPAPIDAHRHISLAHCYERTPYSAYKALRSWDSQVSKNISNAVILEGICAIFDPGSIPGKARKYKSWLEQAGVKVYNAYTGLSVPGGYPTQTKELKGLLKIIAGGNFAYRGKSQADRAKFIEEDLQDADFLKIFYQSFSSSDTKSRIPVFGPDETENMLLTARNSGRKLAAHVLFLRDFESLVDMASRCSEGVLRIEHMPMDGIIKDSTIRKLIDGNISVTPTLTIYRDRQPYLHGMQLSFLKKMKNADNPYLTQEAIRQLTERLDTGDVLTKEQIKKGYTERKAFSDGYKTLVRSNLENLLDKGAPLLFGTDAHGTEQGFAYDYSTPLFREFTAYKEAGLETSQIIDMATADNARNLGLEKMGSIKEGNRADINGFKQNPFENFLELLIPSSVMLAGTFQKLHCKNMMGPFKKD